MMKVYDRQEFRIRCGSCGKAIKIVLKHKTRSRRIRIRCPRCSQPMAIDVTAGQRLDLFAEEGGQIHVRSSGASASTPTVFIAVNDPALAQRFATPLIQDLGARVDIFQQGREVLERINHEPPNLLLTEAGLPDVMGFEIIDTLRSQGYQNLKIILLGSVSRPYRYHRPPNQIYGADAYIEPNVSIPTYLNLVRQLLRSVITRAFEVPQPATDHRIQDPDRARRLARTIITDLVLYHYDRVREAIQNGRFYQLMKDEIDKARSYYLKSVDDNILKKTNYFDEYLNNIANTKNLRKFFEEEG